MIPIVKYFLLTCKHKFYVFIEGLRLNVSIWRLIIHDWSKFMPDELPHYGKQFFGTKDDPGGFINCWVRHQNRHPHHWEYWIPRTGHNRCEPPYKDNEPIPMPMWAVKEMIADWLGAGWAYEGKRVDAENWNWFNNNYSKMRLHEITKDRIELCMLVLIRRKIAKENTSQKGLKVYYK